MAAGPVPFMSSMRKWLIALLVIATAVVLCFAVVACLERVRFDDGRDPRLVREFRSQRKKQVVHRIVGGMASAQRGADLFGRACADCHEAAGRAPQFRQSLRPESLPQGYSLVEYVAESIVDPMRVVRSHDWTTVMPAYPHWSVEETADVVAFVVASLQD